MLERFGLERNVGYRVRENSLERGERELDGWSIVSCTNYILILGNSIIQIYGEVGDIKVKVSEIKGIHHKYNSLLSQRYTDLANHYIRDYTIEEFIMLFNHVIKSITSLLAIIDSVVINHKMEIVPTKRAL